MLDAKAPNTLKAYRNSWKLFSAWCAEYSRGALPATPDTVSLFLTWAAENRKRGTVLGYLAAIRYQHQASGQPLPRDEELSRVLTGIARRKAREECRVELAGKERMTPEQLRRICRELRDDDPMQARDRAMILLGFASAWRGSEICILRYEYVTIEPASMRLWLPFSKTDQQGEGRSVLIPRGAREYTCPVRAMQRWIEHRGDWRGALFPRFNARAGMLPERASIGAKTVCDIVQRALWRIHEDPRRYGGHSLRSGMITAAHEGGASIRAIIDRSGHRCYSTVMRHVKSSTDAIAADPLAGVL